MADKTFEPKYICWYENDFNADVVVRRMTPHQRLMYRSLLQSAFYCSTRPYLPDADQDLADLADADSLQMWKDNKSAVMRKFTLEDGRWSQKRLLADWDLQLASHERATSAGHAGGRARNKRVADLSGRLADAEQSLSSSLANKTETENETETETERKVNQTNYETEMETVSGSVSGPTGSGSIQGLIGPQKSLDSIDTASTGSVSGSDSETVSRTLHLLSVWQSVTNHPCSQSDFTRLLRLDSTPGDPEQYLANIIRWAFNVSNYWPDGLTSSSSFCKAFKAISGQYDNYMSKARASKRDSEGASTSKHSNGKRADDEDLNDDDAFSTKGFEVELATAVPFEEEL